MQGPTAPWDPPCRDNTAPAPSCWPRALPSLTPKQEHTREHTGGLCHTELCWEQLWPKEKKGGEGQRHEGEGGGERRGPSHLCVSPPCPPPTLPPVGAGALQTRSSPVPGLWDTAAQTPGPRGSPGPNGAAVTWQEHIDRGVALGARQAPALAAAVLQHILHRGRAATWNQPRARPLSPSTGQGAHGQGGSRS